MTDEEGNQQRMVVLQKPIPLNQLAIEFQDKAVTPKKQFNVSTKTKEKTANDEERFLLIVENDAMESSCENQNNPETSSSPGISKQLIDELKVKKILKEHSLQCNEESAKQNKNQNENEAGKPSVSKGPKIKKKSKMIFLKKPIPLDSLQYDVKGTEFPSEFPFTVELNRSAKSIRSEEQYFKAYNQWQQNALTIFEFSHVYPFIHATSKYKCIVCHKLFLEPHLLKLHIDSEHTLAEIKEKLTFQVKEKYLKVDISTLQCKVCSVTLTNLDQLKNHLKNHGKDIDVDFKDNIIPFKLNEKQFNCQICSATYSKLRSLVKHMNSNHYNNYSCEYCGAQFVYVHLLKSHLQCHESGRFPCSKCDKVFKTGVNRSNHIRNTHLKHLSRTCPYCPERFSSNYNRTKHIRIAHKPNTELFKCETCGKGFDLKYHLRLHIRSVHLQERNNECKICHLRFFSKYSLSRHMHIHTGDYQFKCQICGKGYSTTMRYEQHCKTHNVVCYTCGADCKDHDCLTAHVKEVHGGV